VQSHGGDLTITTSHGAGTKLTVVLPKSKPDISDTP
jgi:signal transduction histidine kinase